MPQVLDFKTVNKRQDMAAAVWNAKESRKDSCMAGTLCGACFLSTSCKILLLMKSFASSTCKDRAPIAASILTSQCTAVTYKEYAQEVLKTEHMQSRSVLHQPQSRCKQDSHA